MTPISQHHKVSYKIPLPNTIPCMKGELWYGHLCRLALSNGYVSVRRFLHDIVEVDRGIHWDIWNTRMGYDCNRMYADIGNPKDCDWILEGTPFKATSLLLSPFKNGERIRQMSWNAKATHGLVPYPETYANEIRICPECRRAEGDDWYFHIEHNLPLVSTCVHHHCALERYVGTKGYEYTKDLWVPIETNAKSQAFAQFQYGMASMPAGLNLEALIDASLERIHEAGLTWTELDKAIPIMEMDDPLNDYWHAAISNLFRNHTTKGVATTEAFLLYDRLFSGFEDFKSAILRHKPESLEDSFYRSLGESFSLSSAYNDGIVRVRCNACGTVFPTTPLSLVQGWGCPACRNSCSPNEIISDILQPLVDSGWRFELSGFHSWSQTIKATDPNGSHMACKLSDFINYISFDQKRMNERNRLIRDIPLNKPRIQQKNRPRNQQKPSKNKRKVKAPHPQSEVRYFSEVEECGFKLESWTIRKRQPELTIRHDACGGTFTTLRVNFLLSPFCRCCEGRTVNVEKRRPSIGGERRSALMDGIKAFLNERKGTIVSAEELKVRFPGDESRHVSSFLSEMQKEGLVTRIGPRLWCNAGDSFSVGEMLDAHFNRKDGHSMGCPIGDSLLVELGERIESPRHAYAYLDTGKGTAHKQTFLFNGIEVIKVPTKIAFKSGDLAFGFLMTLWNKEILSDEGSIDLLYRKLAEAGVEDKALIDASARFPVSVSRALVRYLTKDGGKDNEECD